MQRKQAKEEKGLTDEGREERTNSKEGREKKKEEKQSLSHFHEPCLRVCLEGPASVVGPLLFCPVAEAGLAASGGQWSRQASTLFSHRPERLGAWTGVPDWHPGRSRTQPPAPWHRVPGAQRPCFRARSRRTCENLREKPAGDPGLPTHGVAICAQDVLRESWGPREWRYSRPLLPGPVCGLQCRYCSRLHSEPK